MNDWRPIPGFPDYEVHASGRVRRADTGYVVAPRGRRMQLYRDGERHCMSIADLVAEAFPMTGVTPPRKNRTFRTRTRSGGCGPWWPTWRPSWPCTGASGRRRWAQGIFQKDQRMNKEETMPKTNRVFVCRFCKESFETEAEVRRHVAHCPWSRPNMDDPKCHACQSCAGHSCTPQGHYCEAKMARITEPVTLCHWWSPKAGLAARTMTGFDPAAGKDRTVIAPAPSEAEA